MQSSWAWAWPWLVRRLQAAVVRVMVLARAWWPRRTGPAVQQVLLIDAAGKTKPLPLSPRAWPESVPQGCRLEVRYAAGGRKYRMVSEGAPPSWPPRLPAPGKRPAMGSLLSATAVCPGHSRLDVYDLIAQYQGPCRDFHGSSRFPVHWLAPCKHLQLHSLYPGGSDVLGPEDDLREALAAPV